MRPARVGLIFVAALVVVFGASAVLAFHEGGVATCTRCHSMHKAKQEAALLANTDVSSTCLNCHEGADTAPTSYHISTATSKAGSGVPPANRGPGGDFRWLSKTYSWTLPRAGTNNGREHGHNIVASGTSSSGAAYGYTADTVNTTAPGGTMLSSGLGCASCHDPHAKSRRDENGEIHNPVAEGLTEYPPIMASGSYPEHVEPEPGYAVGTYRILGGPGYVAFGTTTYAGAPPAIVPNPYNQSEANDQVRVAYGSPVEHTVGTISWAEWCGTCHPDYHVAPASTFIHPVDSGLGDISLNYNKYVKTGDLTGTDADSFNSLVPFAENTNDYAVLAQHAVNDDSVLNGPTTSDRVTCMSCHRAHASAWDNIMRWNQSAEFITLADETTGVAEYAAIDNEHSGEGSFHRGYTEAEMKAAYYDRPATVFAGYQRSLCNKCHIQD
jgi:predicted CXXCH cytochrome family protein